MATTSAKILVIEDEALVRESLRLALEHSGYQVIENVDGIGVLTQVQEQRPALIILDLRLPRVDGWAVLQELRKAKRCELVLMLTGVGDLKSRVRGLESGADDYLAKPVPAEELLAHVKALLRRMPEREQPYPRQLRFQGLRVDLERKTAERNGIPLKLARMEYRLLELFAKHLGTPVSRARMLEEVWGMTRTVNTRTVDTHIWRLRQKLGDTSETGPRMIKNLPRIGYVMECEPG